MRPLSPTPLFISGVLAIVLSSCGGEDSSNAAASPPDSQSPSSSTTKTSASPEATTPTSEPTPSPPEPPPYGAAQRSDLGKVTVYDVEFPVEPQDQAADRIATKNTDFAVADIQVCSNGARTSDGYQYSPSDFLLADEQNRTYSFWNVQIGARSPNLTDSLFGNLAEGMCVRGWLTFELPPETKIKAAAYAPYDGDPLLWLPRPR